MFLIPPAPSTVANYYVRRLLRWPTLTQKTNFVYATP